MDAENDNQLQSHIARLNQRIEDHESAFCGIIEALTENDIKTAFLLATEQLTRPEDHPANDRRPCESVIPDDRTAAGTWSGGTRQRG